MTYHQNLITLLPDLDACQPTGTGFGGFKFSSAYLPPEMIEFDASRDECRVKPYGAVPAQPSLDAWSFGAIMYQLCCSLPLFYMDNEENLVQEDLQDLLLFEDDFKKKKLSRISDPNARNLVSQLLTRDPLHRLTVARALFHPFLTGKAAARLPGEEPEFDVFISYRVASDKEHAKTLYELLTAAGIKVWWDAKCLQPGVPWEDGFCDGLVKSGIFLPLLSRGAINHATSARQSFPLLTEDSACDNVLLEYRLALELREMGLVSKVIPLFTPVSGH